ncbi:DinB family protein [Rhodocytophaga rosea]|uniref:DinB family protein n=1 Tax=Rhodocytophaga rosea TaxID=2704465 RepID=A0A6C0GD78_9BACT|nr:DinB family protein [Rhodocytophaga rosea]QHT65925.1 DinB family protein [Rhodocytophaga rosea]
MRKPTPEEYSQSVYTSRYVNLVTGDDVLAELKRGLTNMQTLFSSFSEDQWNYRYAPGKWTLKELLAHMIDTERIMAYRALCIARGEKQALPGFDEETYAANGNYGKRSSAELLQEYRLVREANLLQFATFDETMLSQLGNANGKDISARAVLFVIAGHERHHLNIIQERYLSSMEK